MEWICGSLSLLGLQARYRWYFTVFYSFQKDETFISLWGKVITIIAEVACEFDKTWQKRKRIIDSMLLIFLIFRLLFSKNSQGYGTTISDFWHNCRKMKFPLPQEKPATNIRRDTFRHFGSMIIPQSSKIKELLTDWIYRLSRLTLVANLI